MRNLVMGCVVAALVALTAKTEAGAPGASINPVPALVGSPTVVGVSSWYGSECQGSATASGEPFDMDGFTAAHWTFPLGTRIRVTNLRNSRSLVLRVNDRGPGAPGRVLDVSLAAARRLGFVGAGLAPVRIEVVSYPHPTPRGRDLRSLGL